MRRGFSLIEVLMAALILMVGMAAAVGLVIYGAQIAKMSIGKASGMATAMTVAVDPDPLFGTGDAWTTATGKNRDGFVNGYWVERRESSDPVVTGITSVVVEVDVYETSRGRHICSYNQRFLRQAPWSGP